MKLLGSLLILLSLSAYAQANEIDLGDAKTVIGGKGYCKADAHIGERVISASDVKANLNGKMLTLTLNIKHLVCTKTTDGFAYRPIKALSKSRHQHKTTKGSYYDLYRLVGHAVVTSPMSTDPMKVQLTNTESQRVSFTWELNKLLAHKDYSKITKDGHSKVSLEYFHTYLNQVIYNGKKYEKYLAATGAYRFVFQVEATNTGWKLRKN